jgi:hypothetical protein
VPTSELGQSLYDLLILYVDRPFKNVFTLVNTVLCVEYNKAYSVFAFYFSEATEI